VYCVNAEQGIFSLLELLDFGLLRSIDDPVVLRLNVINSGSKSIQIAVSFHMVPSMKCDANIDTILLLRSAFFSVFISMLTELQQPCVQAPVCTVQCHLALGLFAVIIFFS
jgi:hypothetical protein